MDGALNWGAVAWQFIRPSSILILMLVLGLLLTRGRYSVLGRRLAGAAAILLVVCGFLPVGYWLIAPLQERFPKPRLSAPPAMIIMLTGAEQSDLTHQHGDIHLNEYADRLTTLSQLAHEFESAKILITGGLDRGLTQAEVARRFIVSTKIEESRVVLDRKSTRTADSADFAAEYLAETPVQGPVWLVTSAFHMPRAIGSFRHSGVDPVPYPTDYRGYAAAKFGIPLEIDVPASLNLLDLAAHEWVGLIAYRLTGKSDSIFPAPETAD